MLYSIDNLKKQVTSIPHEENFNLWMSHLTKLQFDKIMYEIDKRISGNEIATSGWIPGNNWANTPFYPIYTACGEDEVLSGLFFGLLVWVYFMNRSDTWSFGRYEKDGIEIKGLTYYRIEL